MIDAFNVSNFLRTTNTQIASLLTIVKPELVYTLLMKIGASQLQMSLNHDDINYLLGKLTQEQTIKFLTERLSQPYVSGLL